VSKGSIFIISAPSGTGKTTILKKIMAIVPRLAFSVSHTTRAPRGREQDGVDYHFIDVEKFSGMRDKGEFLEWAEVHGNFYGTSRKAVEKQLDDGLDVFLDIDIQGMKQIKAQLSEPVTVFIAPPSWEEQERRLRLRGTDSPATISLRLANGRREIAAADLYDYLLINDTVDNAVEMLRAIILARRSQTRRSAAGLALLVPAAEPA
jgi:guanylate kinase